MTLDTTSRPAPPPKSRTGIVGFDEITGGGLPLGRTTLVIGGPGSGKTLFALQFLAHGAQQCQEGGIFVAFEEDSKRILANASSFDWHLEESLAGGSLFFVDAQPAPDLVPSGDFDLGGLLAVLHAKVAQMGARRIVFDALDIPLALLPNDAARRREIYKLHAWLLDHALTGVVSLKSDHEQAPLQLLRPYGFMEFMVDCAVILTHGMVDGVSQRSLRVQKYRGSRFDENEAPFLIGDRGFEVVVAWAMGSAEVQATRERVSSGVERLDTMLHGGYYRGASILITGFSGTAKTTLCGAFVDAACARGEKTLFVSFDSYGSEVRRNLASVGIRLDHHIASGTLRMVSARAISGSAQTYLARIRALAREHAARCVVVDPVSTWARSGKDLSEHGVTEHLIDWCKGEGITLMCTRLLDEMSSLAEGNAPLQISTLVDTWLHLSYLVQAGERNRGLAIIKSRGTAHSNQVRELVLNADGVTLADTYSAGGEVLMGTLRWEKERAERTLTEAEAVELRLKQVRLDMEEAELEVRLKSLNAELLAKQIEKSVLHRATERREADLAHGRLDMGKLRGADSEPASTGSKPT